MTCSSTRCPFCERSSEPSELRNAHAHAFRDGFPVSHGHTLVVPLRHIARLDDCTEEELDAIWALVTRVRAALAAELDPSPDGFNIGINDGEAAGQTVPHLHVHVIPRYQGDVPDPRGGVRWVLPERAVYWSWE